MPDSEDCTEGKSTWSSFKPQKKRTKAWELTQGEPKEGTNVTRPVDGMTHHIYDKVPEENDPRFEELIRESEEAGLTPERYSSSLAHHVAVVAAEVVPEGQSTWNSFKPQKKKTKASELTQEETKEGKNVANSEDEITNHIYDKVPEETDPHFEELIRENEEADFTPEGGSSSSVRHVVVVAADVSAEFNPGDVSRVSKEAPLEGALPSSSSSDTSSAIKSKACSLVFI